MSHKNTDCGTPAVHGKWVDDHEWTVEGSIEATKHAYPPRPLDYRIVPSQIPMRKNVKYWQAASKRMVGFCGHTASVVRVASLKFEL